MNENFLELCQSIMLALPEESQSEVVNQKNSPCNEKTEVSKI